MEDYIEDYENIVRSLASLANECSSSTLRYEVEALAEIFETDNAETYQEYVERLKQQKQQEMWELNTQYMRDQL